MEMIIVKCVFLMPVDVVCRHKQSVAKLGEEVGGGKNNKTKNKNAS